MTIWMVWVQGDDATWLEAAWTDDMTAENRDGWRAEVRRVREMAYESGYEVRLQRVEVPGVYDLFTIPQAYAESVMG